MLDQSPQMDEDQVKQVLRAVRVDGPRYPEFGTRWSSVYDLEGRTLTVYIREGCYAGYDHGYTVTCPKS